MNIKDAQLILFKALFVLLTLFGFSSQTLANVTMARSPWGGPYARGKAFGDGDSGETWTAFMADANGPDTYEATILKASASKLVTVENLTSTTRTVVLTTIFVPEAATVAFDDGVEGDVASSAKKM